ncbi:MAG: transposase zinc-binding domain-containing protein [Burkholderiaceae bacterium]|nr:transposase zinc-binding domain-containing protein [Burkholderiaceae bacterium]
MQQHAASFIAQTEASTGAKLPRFIKDEFDAFLECGILAHGFLRLRCGECGHDKLLAFSCKRRGFCPSCGARRMSQTAAHLVDRVIPQVPVRQWVLSLPIPTRTIVYRWSSSMVARSPGTNSAAGWRRSRAGSSSWSFPTEAMRSDPADRGTSGFGTHTATGAEAHQSARKGWSARKRRKRKWLSCNGFSEQSAPICTKSTIAPVM